MAGLSLPTKPPNPRAWTKHRDNLKSPLEIPLEREGSYPRMLSPRPPMSPAPH